MRRAMSLWFPTFSADLVRRRLSTRPPGVPAEHQSRRKVILLTTQVHGREIIARHCDRAAALGISAGMDLAHARSLIPTGTALHLEPHRIDRELQTLHALACWALRYSPLAAPDPPDGLWLDITGTQRVHRSESRLIRSASAAAARLGFANRIATASTFGCAWAAARFGSRDLARIPDGRQRQALADLPTAALRLENETVYGLEEIGVTCIGHLLELPRASLASRFGSEVIDRLDQALGLMFEQIDPVRPQPPPRAELIFDGPTDQWESIEAAAWQTLEQLAGHLARRERGVRRLDVELLRPLIGSERFAIDLSRASRSIKHLWSLLHSRLERIDLTAGIEGVVLTATRTARLRHQQACSEALGGRSENESNRAWGELVDTLVQRLGVDRVLRVEPVESHLPESCFRRRSVMEPPLRSEAQVTSADRPTRLFDQPEPVEVTALTPDGPVMTIRWRGQWRQVISCIGPERLGPEWWRWRTLQAQPATSAQRRRLVQLQSQCRQAPPDRDYFALQTETGRWMWVCRQAGTGRWFVHGQWS
ncbi:MAG: DNA polymerase Y family protein [Phycisphaerales bacterium]|nr:DNA polymerase Y family protein [Phycisphaerales bacterium]